MFYDEPPSREILREWLARNDIHVHPALEIVDMDEGTGWMVESAARIPEGELLLSAPKTAVLSPRNSSLYPLLPPALTHPPSSSDNTSIPAATNHALLVFALCILHELRLGKGSRWYGYLQSLPRPAEIAGLLPVFWDLAGDSERTDPADGEVGEQERDMQEGYAWLKGTDAWGDLMRRQREGMGLDDIHSFWRATASSLPPTPIHPSAPSFSSFTYAYTLLSTRAFIIDIYHHTALVPFADIFNHSSFPHTSLASDEFVCHLCGSMALCVHDAVDNDRVPARMGHVHPQSRRKLLDGQEKDTIEMRADREIGKRVEVGNTYGEDMGDGRLLVEYGFIGEEYAGEGIRLEVPFHQEEGVRARAYEVMRLIEEDERREVAGGRTEDPSNAFAALSMDDSGAARSRGGNGNTGTAQGTEDDDSLFYHPKSFRMPPSHTVSHANDTTYSPTGQDEGGWYLSHAGQVSYPLLCLIAVSQLESQAGSLSVEVARAPGQLVKRIRQAVRGLERVYETVRHDEDDDVDEREDESTTLETGSLPAKDDHSGRFLGDEAKGTHSHMLVLARAIRSILQDRLASMYKADIPLTDLFEQRDALAEDRPRTRLAMTLSINERVLLLTAAHKWAEVLRVLQG